jgi:hypothetical protein
MTITIDDRRIFSDSDMAIGIDLSFHEGDGGDMAFTDSPLLGHLNLL